VQDSSEHVEEILKASVKSATYAYSVAKHQFWVVCFQELGEQQKTTAAAAQMVSEDKLLEAVLRLNRFMVSGTIPEELKYLNAPEERAMGASS
jgi:hypothetical protein